MSSTLPVRRLEVVHPERPMLYVSPEEPEESEESRPNVDHLTLVGRIYSGGEVYADEAVIDETHTIRSLGFYARNYVYHATSSIALPAIARHEALLSSRQLLEIEEPIVTGEITTEDGRHHRHINGLPDVYASNSPISTHYAQTTGEHYPVIFGIDSNKLESRPWMDSGDGMRLGARVALNSIAAQIVPYDKLSETKEWALENCPEETVVMSLDAAFLLMYGLGYRT